MRRLLPLLAAGLAACAAPQLAAAPRGAEGLSCPEWSMEGGGPGRASRTEMEPRKSWRVERIITLRENPGYEPAEYATPVVAGPLALVGHSGRAFVATRLDDGRAEWSVPTKGRVYTTSACADGLLIIGDDEGDVRAVSFQGKEVWKFHLSYPVVSSPVAAAGKVYVASADQNVFCLEAATGRPLWQYGRKFPRRNTVWRSLGLAWGDNRLYAGFSDGAVVALDAELGRVLWRAQVAPEGLFSDVVAGPSFADGRVYAGSLKGPVLCLEAATGKEVWRQEAEVSAGFAVGDKLLYAGTASGKLLALSRGDGTKAWETALEGGSPTLPVLAGRVVLAGSSEGSLIAFDALTGATLDRYSPGPGLHAQPVVFSGGILFLSDGGALHWLK